MFGVGNGIEKANKILMPAFFVLFIILTIYAACQPGAIEGYKYIFRIEPKVLADPKTWIFALGQAFFSLSVAGNGTLIYGSYLPDDEDIPEAAGRVALFDTIAAMLAALVIIPAMATAGAQLNQGGPGLLFIYLPCLFKSMPGGYIVAILFFVAVFMAGLSSLINLYEAPIATVQEKLEAKPSISSGDSVLPVKAPIMYFSIQPMTTVYPMAIASAPSTGMPPSSSPSFRLPFFSMAIPNASIGPDLVARPKLISPITPVNPMSTTNIKYGMR